MNKIKKIILNILKQKKVSKVFFSIILCLFVNFAKAQTYPKAYFSNVYQGDSSSSYATNTNSIDIKLLLSGSNFRFTGSVAGTTFTATSGNDVGGVFSYEDLNGNTFSIRGVISRQEKSGSTVRGFYFYANTNHAYLLIIPRYESSFSAPTNNIGTSSDFKVDDLNNFLSTQVSLATSANSVCKDGSASTLNASLSSGSPATYKWYYNTTNTTTTSGATLVSTQSSSSLSASYTPSSITAGTRYYFVQVLNASNSQIGMSNTLAITVNSPPSISSYSASYSSTQSNCQYGISTAISINATAGSGSGPSFQWYSNTSNSNSGGTLINGATNSSFSPSTNSLGSLYYYSVLTNSNSCSTTSNVSALMTVVSSSYNGGSIAGSQSVCTGTNSTTLTVSGYTAGLSILRWESSTVSDFSSNVSTIVSTSSSITVTNLTTTTYYRAVLNGTCNIVQSTYGYVIVNPNTAITVQPSTSTQYLCQNSVANTLSVTGTGAGLTYQWYSNSSNSNTGGSSISGATNSTYTPPTSTVGTKYYYVKVNGTCGSEVTSSVSGSVETYQLTATVSVSPTSVNCGTSSTLSIALNGTSPWDITYSDGINTVSSYGVSTSPKTFTVTPLSTTTYSISSIVDGKYCEAFPSSTATLTVVQPSAPTIGIITQPTCTTSTGTVALSGLPAIGTWTVTATGGSTITGTGTTANFIGLVAGSYTFIVSVGSCSSVASNSATVNAQPAAPSAPTGSASQSFCSAITPKVSDLSATGTSILWYSASSGGSSLATTTNLTTSTHYYASQTVGGCESTSRLDVTVTVTTNPSAPIGTSAQSFCSENSPTVSNLTATGSSILWYAASSGGSSLSTSTSLTSATHYYATQTVSGCESTTRFDVTATVNTTPTISGTTAGSRCGTGTVSLGASASSGTVNWYTVSSGGSSTATGTSYTTPSISTNTTYYVDATNNGCTTTSRTSVTSTIYPAVSIVIVGSTTSFNKVSLTASGGNSYVWNGGANPNSDANDFYQSGLYSVTVTDANGCISVQNIQVKIKLWGISRYGEILDDSATQVNLYGKIASTNPTTNNGKNNSYILNDGLSSSTASTSAYKIKTDFPNSTDGIYWIKNNNINSGTPFQIYADMSTDGGGWMLLNSSGGGVASSEVTSITSISNRGYLPRTTVIELAKISTTVQLRSGPSDNKFAYVTTSSDNKPITALRSDVGTNNGAGSWHYNTAYSSFVSASGTWIWVVVNGVANGWPNMYHSNGNASGVHWLPTYPAGSGINWVSGYWYSTWIK